MFDALDIKTEHYFRLKSGLIVKDLNELIDVLKNMDDSVFYHHVNKERNDFSNWVRDVFKDNGLANELMKINTREQMIDFLIKKLRPTITESKINIEKKIKKKGVSKKLKAVKKENSLEKIEKNKEMIRNARAIPPYDFFTQQRLIAGIRRAYERE